MSTLGGPSIINNDLLNYYDIANSKCYSGSGTTLKNFGTKPFNGSLQGNAIYDNEAKGCVSMGGSSGGYIYIANASDYFPIPTLTVSVWIKSSGLGVAQNRGGIFSMGYGFTINLVDGGHLNFGYTPDNSVTTSYTTSGINFFDYTWRQVTLSVSSTTYSLYVNDSLISSGSSCWTGTAIWGNATLFGFNVNDGNLNFYGKMSSPMIYNRALISTEVLQNYNATKSRFNL